MNREIEFRGKRIDNGEWAYGSLIIELNLPKFTSIYSDIRNAGKSNFLIYPFNAADGRAVEVIAKTVGQYTGLKDKHGNKIFEGDFIKVRNGVFTACIEWNEEYCCFEFDCKSGWVIIKEYSNEYEVVGNKYENPKLLKEAI